MKQVRSINIMKEIRLSVSDELYSAIEYERDSRKLRTVSEMVRVILIEFFRDNFNQIKSVNFNSTILVAISPNNLCFLILI